MKNVICFILIPALFLGLFLYSCIGTGTRVDEIKLLVPQAMKERNWTILRYEGYEWGSWSRHGGKCFYHVCNTDNHNIQYRVNVSLWNGELQWYYNGPEDLSRVDVKIVPETK